MKEQKVRPKYHMELGLDQVRSFKEGEQVLFYRTYLESLKDKSIIAVVLKKALARSGSLGLLDPDLIGEAIEQIEIFEEEFVEKGNYRDVEFQKTNKFIKYSVKKAINLLGVQGDNCQTTFHHRFIYSMKNVRVVRDIVKAAVHHASLHYIVSPEISKEILTAVNDLTSDF